MIDTITHHRLWQALGGEWKYYGGEGSMLLVMSYWFVGELDHNATISNPTLTPTVSAQFERSTFIGYS